MSTLADPLPLAPYFILFVSMGFRGVVSAALPQLTIGKQVMYDMLCG